MTAAQERLDMRSGCHAAKILPVGVGGTKKVWCLSSLICTDEVFSSQGRVSGSSPFRRSPVHALKGCDKEDKSDVTFTAFCLPTLLSWSAFPLESSGSAARHTKLNQAFLRLFCYEINSTPPSSFPSGFFSLVRVDNTFSFHVATMRLLREDFKSNKLGVLRSARDWDGIVPKSIKGQF